VSEPAEPTPGHVIEQGKRLSESMLWRLQRDFYQDRGVGAWSHGNVPQAITTTPHIARAYAKIALGYLRDVDAELDASQPVYIVELGAGSGRFGYRFVKRLSFLLERSSITHKSFTYVMTDAAANMIDYWQTHPSLRPLVDAGVLDFAHFDATRRTDIHLLNSGAILRPGGVANPMIVVANYVFDSIPPDAFSIIEGELFESRVKVTSPRPEPANSTMPPVRDMAISFEPHPTSGDYYAEAALNRVLEGYRQRLTNMMLLFPASAMGCLRHFQDLSSNRALVVVADIGSAHEGDAASRGPGGIGKDGNFWLEVNFHALGEYVLELGGEVFHPPHMHQNLNVSTFVLGQSASGFGETALAYDDAVAQGGPDDFFSLTRYIAGQFESMPVDDLLAFLRSTGWDSNFFVDCLPFMLDKLQGASAKTRDNMYRAIAEAWDVYYPIGEGRDLGFGFGALLFRMEDYTLALEYFQRSLQLVGAFPQTTLNIALCLYRLGRVSETVEWLDRTLELDPESAQANDMRATILAELGQTEAERSQS
jgi:tetratricopeptide (TPR) repeat protein